MRWMWLLLAVPAFAQTGMREQMEASIAKQRAAAALQRESVRRQFAQPMPVAAAESAAAPEMGCDTMTDTAVEPMIQDAARANAMEPKLLRAVIEQESSYRPCAVSRKGAQGLMQLMPGTAADLGVSNPFDPKSNVDAGARFLKTLLEKYQGDLALALGAYNAGPTAVDQAGGVPDIKETKDYVKSIMRRVGK